MPEIISFLMYFDTAETCSYFISTLTTIQYIVVFTLIFPRYVFHSGFSSSSLMYFSQKR
jgi:hypothetical protein